MLDLKFERYLTPQIIRALWLLILLLGISGWGYMLLSRFSMALPDTHTVYQERPAAVEQKLAVLRFLITAKDDKGRDVSSRDRGEVDVPSTRKPTKSAPKIQGEDHVDSYSRMTLDQLVAERKTLEDQYPTSRSVVSFRGLLSYGLLASISTFGTAITLLLSRVACEVLIVIFNIAKSLVQIREAISARSSPVAIVDSGPGHEPNSDNAGNA